MTTAALDPAACYASLAVRDPAGDGAFFVCVATTGIFCRPVCPARTPLGLRRRKPSRHCRS
ncbi:Ada metal-binding domain-containing protein [Sphingomonas bacterium]|uniref:Ada metal-binding domain-containing protein n=1 Tax=Sphingomonas bacterium TaxID=1895847 RepID=UPI0015776958|nr:Ada metal-binding domain-containing protein [Sphingomonas bacterium]